jgi:hypothetical protein
LTTWGGSLDLPKRAFIRPILVGSILIVINHGNAIAAGTVDSTRIVQMILTLLVPYCVSTASSVGAIIDHRAGKTDP